MFDYQPQLTSTRTGSYLAYLLDRVDNVLFTAKALLPVSLVLVIGLFCFAKQFASSLYM
jgi:hypothetical protein